MSGWALGEAGVGPLGVALVALVALVLAFAVHALSRRRPVGNPRPIVDPDLAATLAVLATRMDLPDRVLPAAHRPDGDGTFLWREGGTLHYRAIERGAPIAAREGPPDDAVLYACFHDLAWSAAYRATIGMDEALRPAAIAAEQRRLLAAANPAWGERFAGQDAEPRPRSPA